MEMKYSEAGIIIKNIIGTASEAKQGYSFIEKQRNVDFENPLPRQL